MTDWIHDHPVSWKRADGKQGPKCSFAAAINEIPRQCQGPEQDYVVLCTKGRDCLHLSSNGHDHNDILTSHNFEVQDEIFDGQCPQDVNIFFTRKVAVRGALWDHDFAMRQCVYSPTCIQDGETYHLNGGWWDHGEPYYGKYTGCILPMN